MHEHSSVMTPSQEHICLQCRDAIEPELLAIHPAIEVCLECMSALERTRLESDLNQAQQLDRSLLSELPELEGWEVGLHYRPSRLLSGDFYDLNLDARGGRLSIALGDVMGKGIPAALLRTGLLSTLRALAPEIDSPARVMEKANGHFTVSASPGTLASVFHGKLDVASGRLTFANAGHLPPLVRRQTGEWEALGSTGVVMGAVDDACYEESSVELSPGDLIALYSDGITEAESGSGEFFDERELTGAVDSLADAPLAVISSGVSDAVSRFAPGPPSDDRTLLLLRRRATSI